MTGLRKRIGQYYLGKTIGEGTYAKVKYGQHVETGEAVAVKVLSKARLEEAEMEEQIKREIHILRHLRHPNIVDLREVMASRDSVFMVMELVRGGELFDHILLKGALEEDRAREIFVQLMDGLEYCHKLKIYHRDLKPENVLLAADGRVKLSDFGLGALPSCERGNGLLATICGTPNYVAPEVLRQGGYAGGPADIWSLGVLLYVIASGKLPFEEQQLPTLFQRISRADYTRPLWFSDSLIGFLDLMLQPDPAKRASFAELRRHPWVGSSARREQRPALPLRELSPPAEIFKPTVVMQRLTQGEARAANEAHVAPAAPPRLNAFELLNSALDISALLERGPEAGRRATRLAVAATPRDVLWRLEACAARLGGSAKQAGGSRMKLRGGRDRRAAAANINLVKMRSGIYSLEFDRAAGGLLAFLELFKAASNACADIAIELPAPGGR